MTAVDALMCIVGSEVMILKREPEEFDEAIKVACDALAKQIPRITTITDTSIKCRCGHYVLREWIYCPRCGQALDWSNYDG